MRGAASSWTIVLLAAALVSAGSGAASRDRVASATLRTFAGPWEGHDRMLTITRSGRGSELILASCCERVVALRFRIGSVWGTRARAFASATVTYVHVYDTSTYSDRHEPPRVGEAGTLRIVGGVLHEPLGGATYCNNRSRPWVCGA